MTDIFNKKAWLKSKWDHESRMTNDTADDYFYAHETILPPRELTEERKKEILMQEEEIKNHKKWCELREKQEYNDLEIWARK